MIGVLVVAGLGAVGWALSLWAADLITRHRGRRRGGPDGPA